MIVKKIELSKLHPYEGNPFRVTDDDQMEMLVDSIKAKGIIEPLIVRPDGSGEYEIISGHRRFHACKKLGLKMIPCYVSEMSREDAIVVCLQNEMGCCQTPGKTDRFNFATCCREVGKNVRNASNKK